MYNIGISFEAYLGTNGFFLFLNFLLLIF